MVWTPSKRAKPQKSFPGKRGRNENFPEKKKVPQKRGGGSKDRQMHTFGSKLMC